MRTFGITLALLLFACTPSHATIEVMLWDEFDDRNAIHAAHEKQEVKAVRKTMDEFDKSLMRFKCRDFVAMFGKSQKEPGKTDALPVAEYRVGVVRGEKTGIPIGGPLPKPTVKVGKPFAHPRYWAAFILVGDPD